MKLNTFHMNACKLFIFVLARLVISNASARLYVSSPCLVSKELLYDWLETMGKLDQHDTKDNVSPRFQKFRNERQSVIVWLKV